MEIDRKTVEYVAALSKLRVPENDIYTICGELSTMLDYVDEINSTIDTDFVVPYVEKHTNVMRPDFVSISMDRLELLSNAPQHTDDTPIVPITVR